ncbi:helix-turn-helix transcriptional regulator [Erythrobacter sp. LQ02-29]|uniref:helix-turn-helix transcriptional regulator n=1 Tax=Erythrobacter sp. LQ02-29 TaxID=2920384 RepID=UPI00358E939C
MKQWRNVENGLGSQLRAKRNHLNLSQEELAFEAEVSQTTVSRVERGVRSSRTAAKKIAATLSRLELSDKGGSTQLPPEI